MEEWCDRTTLPHSTPGCPGGYKPIEKVISDRGPLLPGSHQFFSEATSNGKMPLYFLVVTNPSNNPKMINPKERMGLIPAMFLELNEMKTETRNPSGSFWGKTLQLPTTKKTTQRPINKETHIFGNKQKFENEKYLDIYIYIHINIWWLIFIHTIIPIDQHDD